MQLMLSCPLYSLFHKKFFSGGMARQWSERVHTETAPLHRGPFEGFTATQGFGSLSGSRGAGTPPDSHKKEGWQQEKLPIFSPQPHRYNI